MKYKHTNRPGFLLGIPILFIYIWDYQKTILATSALWRDYKDLPI